jgi:glycosyltransferase involved in cell wall biosynthesis
VQNLPLPGDRRVWQECRTLRDAGYRVAAITPKAPGDPSYEQLEGVHLYKYPAPRSAMGAIGYLAEFAYCWVMTAVLAVRVIARQGRPAALQACNPPDTYFLLGRVLRVLLGVRFVFDQHDVCPELYESRFGRRGLAQRALFALERLTYASADHVIATNESYRDVATSRGRVPRERVTVVRTGIDISRMTPRDPRPELRRGRRHLVHFHGVMGPQDSVEIVLHTARIFLDAGRTDTFFNVLGRGDMYPRLRALATDLGVDDIVHMPGRVSDDDLFDSMSTAAVGLSPDLPNPLNEISTMNKTMEYMAFGLPGLSFDLKEARVSAEDSALYVSESTPEAYAKSLMYLLDHPRERAEMGRRGLQRAREQLTWDRQLTAYLSVYERVVDDR